MRESWTRPPLVAREAPSGWLAMWRFRLAVALCLAALVLLVLTLFLRFARSSGQDPGVGASAVAAVPSR